MDEAMLEDIEEVEIEDELNEEDLEKVENICTSEGLSFDINMMNKNTENEEFEDFEIKIT